MAEGIAAQLDENTRRYYLDVMGVQCWELNDSQQLQIDQHSDHGADPVSGGGNRDVTAINWQQLEENIQQCDRCVLHGSRKQALPGRGKQSAELMFLLLSPNARDDENGILNSAELDELFSKMLAAIDINIDDVYISSLLKCAVPANHTVSANEILSCNAYLKQQIQLIQPKLLVVLGETAARCLLQKDLPIDDFRAKNPVLDYQGQQFQVEQVPVFISYSPQELIQQPAHKREAWSDLQQLQKMMQARDI